MDNGILWYPYHERYLPYIYRELDITPDTMVFMGQFRIEEGALPVEGIFINGDSWVHARITSKEIIEQEPDENEDPHKGAFYDEDAGGYIRLFPEDECIQITYTVLKDLPTKEDVETCMEHIEKQGREVWERSEEIRKAREEIKYKEWVAERNREYMEQQAKEAAEKAALEVAQQQEQQQDEEEYYHSDDGKSWHCGCEYDPYPDDPYCGRDPPDFEFEADIRKASGEARHAKKAVYKGNKYHKKPSVFKKECEEHAHHKQRIMRNMIEAQKKSGDDL